MAENAASYASRGGCRHALVHREQALHLVYVYVRVSGRALNH
jgi:hypothetical protein